MIYKSKTKNCFFIVTSVIVVLATVFSPLAPIQKVSADTDVSVTWTTSGDLNTNTNVGPDLIPNTADDGTPGISTIGTQISSSNDQLAIPLTYSGFITIAEGYSSILGIKSDGTLWAWGHNNYGQLGLGDTTDRNVPAQVGSGADWRSISIGYAHTLATKSDGTLWSWGMNWSGQLGLGDTTQYTSPTKVGTDTDWQSIAAGGAFSLAIKSDHTLWSWGGNDVGQSGLGTADYDAHFSPTKVGSDTNWQFVTAGSSHALALKSDGTLWSWGDNSSGQLGSGNTTEQHSPIKIGVDTNWQSVAAGYARSLAIKSDGTLWAWGDNSNGQLGLGDTTQRTSPVQVGVDTDWQSIANGGDSLYGISFAIKQNGTLWAWGDNSYGDLGLGDRTQRTSPTQVGTDTNWQYIATGSNNSIALKSDYTLWSWGDNSYGQLGLGTFSGRKLPAQVGTDTTWQSVSAGYYHSLAIKSDGTLWAWGDNNYGQLGLGDTTTRISPIQVGSDTDWQSVSAGYYQSLAIKSDGTLWAWGDNSNGQLGLGDTTQRTSPIKVGVGTDWQSIVAGGTFALDPSGGGMFSLAIKSDHTLWSWGNNPHCELGLGDNIKRTSPTKVGTGTTWQSIAAGDFQSFATKSDHTLWSWGLNSWGQLGLGNTTEQCSPTKVGTDTDWQSVATGWQQSFAIKSDYTLWSWGQNMNGQLGLGTFDYDNHMSPVQVGAGTDWQSIAAGDFQSLAIKSGGTLWAWGSNGSGQLGLGDGTDRYSPTQVGTDIDWQGVSAGTYHTLALKSDGTLWAWGNDNYGQLGFLDDTTSPTHVGSSNWKSPYVTSFSSATLSGLKVNADADGKGSWSTLSWASEALPLNTSIKFRVRTSDDNITYSDWSDYFTQDTLGSTSGTADLSGITSSQYLEMELTLTSDTTETPTLSSFTLNYAVVVPSSANAITAFTIPNQIGDTTIDGTNISITMPSGTDVSSLTPTITITGVSVSPDTGVAQDFTLPVTYTVTAEDSTPQEYTVTVNVAPPLSSAKAITSFTIPNQVGDTTINGTDISLTMPAGTNVSSLTPAITITGVSVSPDTGVAQDFSSPVTYTVTASNGTHQAYIVTVTLANPVVEKRGSSGGSHVTPPVIPPSTDHPEGCSGGNHFNTSTGALCVNNAGPEIPGCGNRTTGFSTASGLSCLGNRGTGNESSNGNPSSTGHGPYNFGLLILRNGSRGNGVMELQRFLNATLNLGLVVDGRLGPKTIAVIKQWQKAHGLTADGLVGPKTKALMNSLAQ